MPAPVCARNLVAFHKRHLTWPKMQTDTQDTSTSALTTDMAHDTWLFGLLVVAFVVGWLHVVALVAAVVVAADSWSSSVRMCCAFFTSICLAFVAQMR